MKKVLAFVTSTVLFFSCQKNNVSDNVDIDSQTEKVKVLVDKAKNTLKANMAAQDFATLNWENIQANNLKSKNPVLRIASKADKNKFLYYSDLKNNEVYDWVKYQVTFKDNKINGAIHVYDVKNQLLREIDVKDSKVLSTSNSQTPPTTTTGTVVTLDEVIVTGYINQQSFNLLSYWWIFSDLSYSGQYESVESIEEALNNYGGGGGGTYVVEPVVIVTIDSVKNNLTQPCLNNAFNAISSDRLTNSLSKLYQQTFVGLGHVHNLVINQVSSTVNQYPAQSRPLPGQPSTWEIQLNSGYQGLFTQELWGSLILHELVHGFIQKNNLDFGPTSQYSNAHTEMLNKWITQIQNALVESFGMSSTNALALSLSGFDDILTKNGVSGNFKQEWVATIQAQYGINLFDADAIQTQYLDKLLGTPCQ